MKTIVPSLAIVVLLGVSAAAQWTNVPRSSIPRTPDGKPNLAAPAPRLVDGKPDLQGVWQRPYTPDMSRNGRGQTGYAEPPFMNNDSPASWRSWFMRSKEARDKYTSPRTSIIPTGPP